MSDPNLQAPSPRLQWRLRLGAWSLGLVAVAFIQAPGRIVTDTKLDLTVDPVGFLGRSLHLWDPNGAFGQVQNQAYGYLFPMGPLFAGGELLGVPPWATQRLWWSLVLVVAFLGVVKLCGALGVGTGWSRIAAGLVFALSPRFLSVIGPSSIEVWPSAIAPWVLVPLVIGLRRGDPRRQAAWSAVAVACVGGVNAAATFAVIPLAALWLVLAPRGPRRRSLMLWWPVFVLMGTAWWLLPLFLLGHYSPPFLDYIESATNTTFAATAFDALRGTTDWVPYVDVNSVAGNHLISEPLLIANGVVLMCFGVLGLSRASLPHRRFLLSGLLLGLVLVTLGHRGAVDGFGATTMRDLLDGVLAPLRNTHKFDVLIRLPLVIALCHALAVLTRGDVTSAVRVRRVDATAIGVAVLAAAAIAGATVPAWSASLANRSSFTEIPGYWRDAASWLEGNAEGRTLLTPATGFGDYAWGKTADEPLQALAKSPWAVRNLIPLAPGGNIEMLDAISDQFETGRGSEGFASFLRRAGIGTLVVRHDLNRAQDMVPPELVRATLTSTPGIRRVASFGPEVGGGPTLPDANGADVFVDGGWQTSRPALEVFTLEGVQAADAVTRQSTQETPVLVGDADSLLSLDALGVTSGSSVVMAKDAITTQPYGSTILTDGNRRQESSFGSVHDQRSASLTPQERYSSPRRVHRYDEEALARWTTTPQLRGAKSISSSSSRAEVGALPSIDQSAGTWAAFDGDPSTGWEPALQEAGRSSWVRVDFGRAVDVGLVTFRLALPVGQSRTLTVTTGEGPRTVRVQGRNPVTIEVGRVANLKVTGRSTVERRLVISDIAMSGVELSRPLVLPEVPSTWGAPSRILLQAGPEYADGCATFDGIRRCSPAYYSQGEGGRTLDRELTMPAAQTYDARLRVAGVGGPALTALLLEGRLTGVTASSQVSPVAEADPLAAVDGSMRTGWVASDDDLVPSLTLRWVGEQTISQIRLRTSTLLAASVPREVRLIFSDGTRVSAPVSNGMVKFNPVATSSVRIEITADSARHSVDFTGAVRRLPAGVSEAAVSGVGGFPIVLDTQERTFACGSGPAVAVDGERRRTAIHASPHDLAAGLVVDARVCDGGASIELPRGSNSLSVVGTEAVRPVDLLLTSTRGAAAVGSGEESRLIVETHNANAGWTARAGSTELKPIVLNGWQQGWIEPVAERGEDLDTSFAPDRAYRLMLAGGALLLVLLLVTACLVGSGRRAAWPLGRPARRGGSVLLVGATLAAAALVAGPWGLVAASAGILVPMMLRASRPEAATWLAVGAVAAAGTMYALRPWAGPETWAGDLVAPQLLVMAALGTLSSGVVEPKAFLRRRKGISTKR